MRTQIFAVLVAVIALAGCQTVSKTVNKQLPPPTYLATEKVSNWSRYLYLKKDAAMAMIANEGFTNQLQGAELYDYVSDRAIVVECEYWYTIYTFNSNGRLKIHNVDYEGGYQEIAKASWQKQDSHILALNGGDEPPGFEFWVFQNPQSGEVLALYFSVGESKTYGATVQISQEFAKSIGQD